MVEVEISRTQEEELFSLYKDYPLDIEYFDWLKNNIQGFIGREEWIIWAYFSFDTEENANLFKMKYMA